MIVRRAATVVTCVAALVLPASAAAGSPAAVACGDLLTVDTVLAHDLTCDGDGLRLAPGVSLDLGGHTLRGPGTGTGVHVASEGAAVVSNGTVTGWRTGVRTLVDVDVEPDAGPLRVERVRFRDNGTGVHPAGDDSVGVYDKPTTVVRSTFTGHTRAGVDGNGLTQVVVDRSTFTDNDLGVVANGDGRVTGSRFVRNARAVVGVEAHVEVVGSTFEDNAEAVIGGMTGSLTVRDSRFSGSQVAVESDENDLVVEGSRFRDNVRAVVVGIYGGSVTGNDLRDNGEAIGHNDREEDGISRLSVRDNLLRRNGEGILLDTGLSLVELGGNDVRGSSGWGIYADGATDLGGNTARGNGNEPQCVGVVCATS